MALEVLSSPSQWIADITVESHWKGLAHQKKASAAVDLRPSSAIDHRLWLGCSGPENANLQTAAGLEGAAPQPEVCKAVCAVVAAAQAQRQSTGNRSLQNQCLHGIGQW